MSAASPLPPAPVPPARFFEELLPAAFAARGEGRLPASGALAVGVRLEGEGGGSWTLRLTDGALAVEQGLAADVALQLVQTVEDWRGALWEERGGAVGRQAGALFRAQEAGVPLALQARGPAGGRPLDLSVLEALRSFEGRIRVEVDEPRGAWRIDLVLGGLPGAAAPTTFVRLGLEDCEALERGEMEPFAALLSGRIDVRGDLSPVLALQALLLEASAPSLD